MGIVKHVGRHAEKKVVIVRRTVPNEPKNALIAYSDSLPTMFHDDLMKMLESDVGQQAKSLDEALFRSTMQDGRNLLQAMHSEGYIKKVPTIQIVVTPTNKDSVRLDELNSILDKMETEEGTAEVKKADEEIGLRDPGKFTQPRQAKVTDKELREQVRALTEQVAELSKIIQNQDNKDAPKEESLKA